MAGQKLSAIVYRFGEASTLSIEARAPRRLYLEGEDKLFWVEFRYLRRERALRSKTWIRTAKVAIAITLVYCLNSDETGCI